MLKVQIRIRFFGNGEIPRNGTRDCTERHLIWRPNDFTGRREVRGSEGILYLY